MSQLMPAVTNSVDVVSTIANSMNCSVKYVHCVLAPKSKIKSALAVKVREEAQRLGYNPTQSRRNNLVKAREAKVAKRLGAPANLVFKNRDEETNAMRKLRTQGYSNAQIAAKCGVCHETVINRIGVEPENITAANKKLSGKIIKAKNQLRIRIANENMVREYNAKVEAFNVVAEKLLAQYKELVAMKSKANKAAEAAKLKTLPITKLH